MSVSDEQKSQFFQQSATRILDAFEEQKIMPDQAIPILFLCLNQLARDLGFSGTQLGFIYPAENDEPEQKTED